MANFNVLLLRSILDEGRVAPVTNMVESHPFLCEHDLFAFCQSVNVALMAHLPEAATKTVIQDQTIQAVACEAGKTPLQTVLRWNVQHGRSVLLSSADVTTIRQSHAVLDWQLTASQMAQLDALDRCERFNVPAFYDFAAIPRGHIRNQIQAIEKPGYVVIPIHA